jgi:hypothetical protein
MPTPMQLSILRRLYVERRCDFSEEALKRLTVQEASDLICLLAPVANISRLVDAMVQISEDPATTIITDLFGRDWLVEVTSREVIRDA